MPSLYEIHLPSARFEGFVVGRNFATDLISVMMVNDPISSFALTADAPPGKVNLWLSHVSMKKVLGFDTGFDRHGDALTNLKIEIEKRQ